MFRSQARDSLDTAKTPRTSVRLDFHPFAMKWSLHVANVRGRCGDHSHTPKLIRPQTCICLSQSPLQPIQVCLDPRLVALFADVDNDAICSWNCCCSCLQVHPRYSEFYALNKLLRDECPSFQCAVPPKQRFGTVDLEARRNALARWLDV